MALGHVSDRGGGVDSLLIVAGLVTLFTRVHRCQRALDSRLDQAGPLDFGGGLPPLVIVPVARLARVTEKALHFAVRISADVEAVHVAGGDGPREHLVLRSEYREFVAPPVEHALGHARAGREVVVMVPEVVPRRWYHHLLEGHRATLLRAALLLHGNPRMVIASAPWYEEPEEWRGRPALNAAVNRS